MPKKDQNQAPDRTESVENIDPTELELQELEEMSAPGFWEDPEAAKPLLQKRGTITNEPEPDGLGRPRPG